MLSPPPSLLFAGETGNSSFTEQKNPLRTIIVDHYYPYTFLNEIGVPDGFSVDLITAAAETMGLKLDIRIDTWENAVHALRSGEIDFLPMMAYSQERDQLFDFSAPHTIAFDAFFTRKDSIGIRSLADLTGKKIIVMNHDQAHDYLRSLKFISPSQLILVNDLKEALQKLASGEGDAALMPKLVGLCLINKLALADLEISPIVIEAYKRPFSIAVKKGDQELLERLSQGVEILKENKRYRAIHDKWFGAYESADISFGAMLHYSARFLLFIAFLCFGMLGWNFFLKRQVAEHTKNLREEIENRKRVEAELKGSEAHLLETNFFLNAIMEGTTDAIFIKDMNGRYLMANPATCAAIGRTRDEIIGKNDRELFPADSADVIYDVDSSVLEGRKNIMIEERLMTAYGDTWWLANKSPLFNPEGKIIGLIGISRDITEIKTSEKKLIRLKERLEALWGMAHLLDQDLKEICDYVMAEAMKMTESEFSFYGFINKEENAMTIHSWSGSVMSSCQQSHNPMVFNIAQAGIWGDALRQRKSLMINDYQADSSPNKKGLPAGHVMINRFMIIPVFWEGKIVSLAAVANRPDPYEEEDLIQLEAFLVNAEIVIQIKRAENERKNLETRLMHAQKMEAIGTLAGGIAHDFNNILGVILGYADLAQESVPPESILAEDLQRIIESANRARDLVRQILAFSRQSSTELINFQPASIIKEGLKMLRASLPATIEMHEDVDSNCDVILADPTQLHQILMNLCTNAFHAMEESGGELRVSLKNVELPAETFPDRPDFSGGKFVELTVSDTGSGIDPELQDKIFDPYFTTKSVGKGTGMGLAIVRGIVTGYGGKITCQSSPEKGAAFRVFFPVSAHEIAPETESTAPISGGKERILIVDDEKSLLHVGKVMLQNLGYTVTTQTSSRAALELFKQQADLFDLIITDQTMPGISGTDLAARMLQIRPDIPIILCTGYSSIISREKALATGIKEYILKPIAKKHYARIVRKVLDGNKTPKPATTL